MRFRTVFASLALVAVPLVSSKPAAAQGPTALPFTVLDQGAYSGVSWNAAELLITRASLWSRVWAIHGAIYIPAPPAPAVDFAQNDVVAVFMGMKSSGGFSTAVTSVTTDGARIDVFVDDMVPGPGCPVTDAITHPFVFVKIPKLNLPVVFHHNVVVGGC